MRNPGRTTSAIAALVIAGIYATTPNPIWLLVAAVTALALYNLYTAQIRDK
ncbi:MULTISPECIES: hypothetical protein [Corynebacterium]|uniref:hypothetical protein n=1 Tax=Corynebacterium TaxID=1716 RepID=UPI0002F153B1|nr:MULTISPECIES: hypothetical protein [Corynebacterium]AWR15479.1 hypothetical protein B11Q_00778 [Corynebacterium diphtheriae]MBG9260248.1 hypothetical protein [Corynebacterium belfantii]MBG9267004.1 hypothetical protein [Corynebacterium belfantii]MBG9287018.1 hypothetical protein [Corynebacterium belfantii]MBG9298969.1 hypothetical protein [Corynebacterium belfantii]